MKATSQVQSDYGTMITTDSNFDCTIGFVTFEKQTCYLSRDFRLGLSRGVGPKKFVDMKMTQSANPFRLFGAWTLPSRKLTERSL